MGGSNGGLLMGAEITQHPDLARAVVSAVGIYDMVRVELDPNGSFNATEFGTVKDPEQFKALYAYSPYHHVQKGIAYPAVLMLTGATDGRVNPMHSRKFAAALQAATNSNRPILLAHQQEFRPRHRQLALRAYTGADRRACLPVRPAWNDREACPALTYLLGMAPAPADCGEVATSNWQRFRRVLATEPFLVTAHYLKVHGHEATRACHHIKWQRKTVRRRVDCTSRRANMLVNTLKTAALAALLGVAAAGTSGTSASAYTIKTRCFGNDCVRMQCNDYGYDCFRVGYVDRDDYDRAYTRTYTYYPYSYDFDDGYYGNRAYYGDYDVDHYRNHSDYDNDYDEDDYPR